MQLNGARSPSHGCTNEQYVRNWTAFVYQPLIMPYFITQGTPPFLSVRLVLAWLASVPIIQTATDDLESFLWVFLWALTNILEGVEGAAQINQAIPFMKEALDSKDLAHILHKSALARNFWISHDIIFGDFIRDWIRILSSAEECVCSYTHRMAETPAGSSDREEACNELESFCKGVYEAVLTSGYRHLEGISQYSCWKDVVDAMQANYPRYRDGNGIVG